MEFSSISQTRQLTDLQRQMWHGHLLYADTPAYTLSVCLHLEGIDPDSWRRAFESVVENDPMFSTHVAGSPEEPRIETVVVARPSSDYLDLRGGAPGGVTRIVETRRKLVVDPTKKVFDSLLVRIDDVRFRWFLAIHHIFADGWSVKVIVERTLAAYCARRGTQDASDGRRSFGFPNTANEQSEYARELASYRVSADYRADEGYWKSKLERPIRPTNFYGLVDGHRPGVTRRRVSLGPERTTRLRAIAESAGGSTSNVNLANFLATALLVFLSKMSGESYLSLGLPFSNRRTDSRRKALGLFMLMGVLRVEIDETEGFDALQRRVAAEARQAGKHARYPLNNANNRLYDVMLNVHNVHYSTIAGREIGEEWLHSGNDTLPFTLHVRTSDRTNLQLEFDLQPGVFPATRRKEITNHFVGLLDQVIANPHSSVIELTLTETPGPLATGPPFHAPIPGITGFRIHDLFNRQAEKAPKKIAVYSGRERIRFAELRLRSDMIASALREIGIHKGSIVAVSMRRSIGAIAAILGVLKAGGIWLPLDSSYPRRLLHFMLRDSAAQGVITESGGPIDPSEIGTAVLIVNPSSGKVERSVNRGGAGRIERFAVTPAHEEEPTASKDVHAAYCLYTSGSSGQPKGVIGSHEAVINRLRWMWREYPFAPKEVILQKTSFGFIDSVWEIFGALSAGRALVIAEDTVVRDPRRLAALVGRFPIRRIILVATLLRTFIESPGGFPEPLKRISRWFVTGELLSPETVRPLVQIHPGAEVYNLYGTTETCDAACHGLRPSDFDRRYVPIGRAIDNMEVWVLDAGFNVLPTGVRGELFVRGIGVGTGYLGRPDLTAKKFINGAKGLPSTQDFPLFRTGDAARLLPSGEIECLGRLDHMVKIEGFRIELEEVEQKLRALPGVSQAVATVGSNPAGDGRLLAYVTPRPGRRLHAPQLLVRLREELPAWMIPTISVVASLPRTPSGKLVRIIVGTDAPEELVEPLSPATVLQEPTGDPLETSLLEIWKEVLETEALTVFDNFFDLGGNSLLALRATAEIERRLRIRLPLSTFFEAPTIRRLARRLLRSFNTGVSSPVLIHVGAPGRLPLFSVPPAGSTVSAFGLLARGLPVYQPLYSFQPRGIEPNEIPHRSIEEMARAYIEEMKTVQPRGPYILSGRCFGGYVAYEMAQQLCGADEAVAALIIIDSPEAPLEDSRQRAHVGVRKLLLYYPGRIRYFLRRRRLFYTLRMKIRNDAAYAVERLLILFRGRAAGSRERRLRILRRLHTLAYHRYVAKPYAGTITIFWADGLPDITGEKQKWERLAAGGIEWYTFPSRHHELLKEPSIKQVALQLSDCLERTQTDIEDRTIS